MNKPKVQDLLEGLRDNSELLEAFAQRCCERAQFYAKCAHDEKTIYEASAAEAIFMRKEQNWSSYELALFVSTRTLVAAGSAADAIFGQGFSDAIQWERDRQREDLKSLLETSIKKSMEI